MFENSNLHNLFLEEPVKKMTDKLYPWKTVHIPECLAGEPIVVGVDEAGRGPVLGPLVYATAFWPLSLDEEISKLAFNDSKQLSHTERENLLNKIISHPSIGYVIEEIDSVTISEEMLRSSPVSLNTISYDAVVRALKKIVTTNSVAPVITTVFVDTVGDPDYYRSKLVEGLGEGFAEFVIEKKADAKYKTVSAASIVAKVTRDRIVADWVWREKNVDLDKNFGSGYPGDDACVQWLLRARSELFGFPDFVRFSWSTTRESLKGNSAEVSWECDEEESQGADIKSFFGAGAGKKKRPRTTFFNKRKLQRITLQDL